MDTYLLSLSNMQNGDKKYPHIYTKIQSTAKSLENAILLQANDISHHEDNLVSHKGSSKTHLYKMTTCTISMSLS